MNPLPRFLVAAVLAVSFALPAPALALRPQTDRTGLEEELTPAAGMEEVPEELGDLPDADLERFFLEELEKPPEHRTVFPVYVRKMAIRRRPNQTPHHTGAMVSVAPKRAILGVLPMQNYVDDPQMRIRVAAKIHRLERYRRAGWPIHVVVQKKGRAYQAGRIRDFVFEARPRLTQGDFPAHPQPGPGWSQGAATSAGMEESQRRYPKEDSQKLRRNIAEQLTFFSRFQQTRDLPKVKAAIPSAAIAYRPSVLEAGTAYFQLETTPRLIKSSHPLKAFVVTREKGRQHIWMVDLQEGDAVRVPAASDRPVMLASANHQYCTCCIAQGTDSGGKRWLIQWHYIPPEDLVESSGRRARNKIFGFIQKELPKVLLGLHDIRVVISHREDMGRVPAAQALQEEWNKRLGDRSVASVSLFSRRRTNWVSTIANAQGIGLMLHPIERELADSKLSQEVERLVTSSNLHTFSWNELFTQNRRISRRGNGVPISDAGKMGPPRAGMEEKIARVAAVTEEAAQGGAVVILDAGGLEEQPALQAMIGRLERLSDRVILYGSSPAAEELVADRPEIPWVRTPAGLSDALGNLAQEGGVEQVTFLGGLEEAEVVRPIAEEWGLSFAAVPPTLTQLLAAFIPGPLAAELAAGLEQVEATAGEA